MLKGRLQYLHELCQDFKSERLGMKNKDRNFFKYSSGDLLYLISPLRHHLHTIPIKVTIKYLGQLVIYKIIDPHNYIFIMLDGKILRSLFKHERF